MLFKNGTLRTEQTNQLTNQLTNQITNYMEQSPCWEEKLNLFE